MTFSVIVPVEITKGTSSGSRMIRISAASIVSPVNIGDVVIGSSINDPKTDLERSLAMAKRHPNCSAQPEYPDQCLK
jgi:hypothetical protein